MKGGKKRRVKSNRGHGWRESRKRDWQRQHGWRVNISFLPHRERKRGYFFFATCNFEKLSFSIQLFGASFASFKKNYKYILKILSLCCHVLDKTWAPAVSYQYSSIQMDLITAWTWKVFIFFRSLLHTWCENSTFLPAFLHLCWSHGALLPPLGYYRNRVRHYLFILA